MAGLAALNCPGVNNVVPTSTSSPIDMVTTNQIHSGVYLYGASSNTASIWVAQGVAAANQGVELAPGAWFFWPLGLFGRNFNSNAYPLTTLLQAYCGTASQNLVVVVL